MTQETPETQTIPLVTHTFCLSLPVDTRPYHNDPHRQVHEDGENNHAVTQEHRFVLSYSGKRYLGFGFITIIVVVITTTTTTMSSPL